MEKSRNSQNDQTQSQDTSRKGREEPVVNNQDQNRKTNFDIDDSINRNSSSSDQGRSEGRTDQKQDQQTQGKEGQDQKANESEKEGGYRQGMGDNDNRNSDVPDIGREDAERTKRESPNM